VRIARALTIGLAACVFVMLAFTIARRLFYPYDLEWLEGMTLWHAQRLVEGQAIYPPPTLAFVPLPYTPLYPALLALVGRAVGVTYALGRVLSVASFAGALVIGWRYVRAAGGGRALATAAMAIPCAAYVPTGAWIDLARVDSLGLLLIAAGTTLAFTARRSTVGVATAAALLVFAFFAKQTAAPFMIATALGLAVADRRAALVFAGALALFGLPALWAMQRASDGWFWFYVYKVHHAHRFFVDAALRLPGRTALLLLPGVPLVVWALRRDRTPLLRWSAWLLATALVASSVARGTAGAYMNAFLPVIYFAALFVGVAAARLLDGAEPRRAAWVWALVGGTIATAPGGIPLAFHRLFPGAYRSRPIAGYDPRPYLPTPSDRAAGAAFVARVRATPGEVWLVSRPWYARLAGKTPLAGEMGASDLQATDVPIAGFAEAMQARRFVAVAVDEPHEPVIDPLFARTAAQSLDGPRDLSGIRVARWWLTPK
jgi:hypothetical protein